MRRRAIAFAYAFQIDLRFAAQQHAHRFIFGRTPRTEEFVINDLADVRDVIGELFTDRDQRPRHHQLRNRQPVCRLDLAANRLVRGERAFVTLTKMQRLLRRDRIRRRQRRPERGDDEIVIARVVGVEVIDVNPFGARRPPRQWQALRDDAHAVAAGDQRVRLRELHADAARQRGVFHQVGDVHELRATT